MKNFWNTYKSTIYANCTAGDVDRNSIQYSKNQLFSALAIYIVPLSLIALVPGIYLAIKLGIIGMLIADFITIGTVVGVILLPGISVFTRKLLFNAALYFVSFVTLHYLGSNGPGMLFLLAITIFVVLTLPQLYGYVILALNTLTCLFFALAIHYEFASTILLAEYQVDTWIGVSSNLVFLSGAAVLLIPHLFKSLQSSFDEQALLKDKLEQSLDELKLSEQKFKALVQDGSDLIAILDEKANYTYVAPTAESVLGIPAEEFIGTNAIDYIHPDDQERIAATISNLVSKERIEVAPFRFRDNEHNWRWIESTITNMLENPAVEGFVANSRDVTEGINREHKLQESLELYEYVTRATDDVVYDWDIKEDILGWDNSFNDKFVYDIEKGKYSINYWAQNIHPEDLEETQASLHNTLNDPSQSKWEQEYRFIKQDGNYATVFERGYIIRDKNGNAIRMIGSLQDITDRKEYQEKLEQLSLVAAKTTDVIIMTDENDRITWVNEAYEKLTGYSFEESIGKNPGDLLQGPETDPTTIKRLSKAVSEKYSIQEVVLNYSKTGEPYWLDLTIDPILDNEGHCEGFIAIEKDVSDQVEKERELSRSLKEKETLLAEIHHRVKNNMAVVSGMMQLQAFEEHNSKLRRKLMDSVGRIQTMGTIHEILYQSNSFSELHFDKTVRKLISKITETINPDFALETHFDLPNLPLNINQAIPCSLIINEVVTNILKHGFKKRKKGTITTTLMQRDEVVILKIEDDGQGLPKNFAQLQSGKTLGLKLIDTLAQQLNAIYKYLPRDNGGTQFMLLFEKADVKGIGNANLN